MKKLLYFCPLIILYLIFLINSTSQTKIYFDKKIAFEYLKKQCEFGPRNPSSKGHKACMNYLINEMKKFTKNVIVQKFTHYDSKIKKTLYMSNIIGTFSSSKSNAPRRILCAHWDTRPMADKDPDIKNRNKPILGANDGASGIAVLLEIARIMSKSPPPLTIDIILFDGEDYGEEGNYDEYFMGSRYFAQNPVFRGYEAAVLLDMIGDKNLQIPKEAFSNRYFPQLVNNIWNRANKLGIKQFIHSVGFEILDDHIMLAESGIPAIDIIDFDYKYWHTIQDTPDKCSPESLEAVGKVI
ncbi:M28 family peptidase, partial [candidate division KSB1 bacterium]